MACNIEKNAQGQIVEVRANDGSPSTLYRDLKNQFGEEQAVDMFLASHSDSFEVFTGAQTKEPTVKEVVNFLQTQNKTDREVTKEEIEEVNNLQMVATDLSQKLTDIFYDKDGYFTISPKKMSTFYTRSEIRRIENSPEIQAEIKETLDALNNTEAESTNGLYSPSELEVSNTYGKLGKLLYINPEKVKEDTLAVTAGLEYGEYENAVGSLPFVKEYTTEEESKQYTKAEVLVEVDGEIKKPNVQDRVLVGVNLDKVSPTLLNALSSVLSHRTETLFNKTEDFAKLIKVIEKHSADIGVDLIGVNSVEVLDAFSRMITNPNEATVGLFSAIYEEYFPQNISYTKPIKKVAERDYVSLNTNLTESEVFEQTPLIKVDNNTYIKVLDNKSLEELYGIATQYDPKITKQEIQRRVVAEQDPRFMETSEKILLLKTIFDVKTKVTPLEVKEIGDISNYNYLTTDYVADFNAKIIKGKLRNTPKYEMFYSNFFISETGQIQLKYTDDTTLKTVDNLADENLRKYSLLDKDFPTLTQTTEMPENLNQVKLQRDFYVNNPQEAPTVRGQTSIIDSQTISVDNASERFLKSKDGGLWENVRQENGRGIYKKLQTNKLGRFYVSSEQQIENYNNLIQSKQLKEKLKTKVNESLKSEAFDCI